MPACLSVRLMYDQGITWFLHPFLLHLLEFGVGGLGLRGGWRKSNTYCHRGAGSIPTLQFFTSLRPRTTVEHLRLVL